MTDTERARLETRLETFERNADELWKMLHDPYLLARHLADLLRKSEDVVVGLGVTFALGSLPAVLDYFF